jgi:hypothetical protein
MDVDSALTAVPVNKHPLIDDTDFKTIESAVAYNAAGMALKWNFVTTAGAFTQTAVTPTTGGTYDWTNKGGGMYSIEIPASGGASINNDTEGFGWFSGVCTGVLPWSGPIITFRASGINDKLVDSAYDTNRGLAGLALPAAAADAAGGLPISDAGGLNMDGLSTLTQTQVTGGAYALNNASFAFNSGLDLTTTQKASVNTEADTALTDIHLDHLLATDYDPAAKPGTATALLNELVENDGGVSRYTANALEQAPTGGGGDGSGFTAIPWNAAWDTEVQSEVQDAIEANNLDHLVKNAVDTNFATTVHLDSVIGQIADAGGTATFDRTTDALEILGAATAPTAAAIADAVWDEATAGHVAAGSFGKLAADVLADTNELQTDWADGGRLDLLLDAAGGDYYWAKISYSRDDAGSTDKYKVIWVKNAIDQTGGITNAQVTVKKDDGTVLIATTNMTQIGATGEYAYEETVARQTAGDQYTVTCTATIDSSTRTWKLDVGRDSS